MIHDSAIIDPTAEIAGDVKIGPFAVIGAGVKIGRGTTVGPHAVIEPSSEIGENNRIFQGVSIGGEPQDLGFKNQKTHVRIGNGNTIREFVTIHRATKDGEATIIGDDNYMMAYSHVAHDCRVGNRVIITNCTALAGHVEVGDGAVISAYVGIHQFVRIGEMAMVSGLTRASQDVLPYMITEGNPPSTHGLNVVGLRRNGVGAEVRKDLKKAYKLLCRRDLSVEKALSAIENEVAQGKEIKTLVEFIKKSKRGIIR